MKQNSAEVYILHGQQKQTKIKYETYVNLLTGKGMCNTKHTLSVFYSLT